MQKNDNEKIVQFEDYSKSSGKDVDIIEKQPDNVAILQLPTELVNYRSKIFLLSFSALAFGVAIAGYVKDWQPLLLSIVISVYFFVKGLRVSKDYQSGRICELVATCTGIKPAAFYKEQTTVTFAAIGEDDSVSYFKFIVPKRKVDSEFIIDAVYVIYFDKVVKNTLIGYIQVATAKE